MTMPSDLADLTAHIETHYHANHRQQLPHLIALARKVEGAHAAAPSVPRGLADLLAQLAREMEGHMAKEEQVLFPAIRRGGMPGIEHPIRMMRADHADHAEELNRICALTGDLTLPDHACGTWARLYADLGVFVAELSEHIRLENEVLFPAFDLATPNLHRGCACHG